MFTLCVCACTFVHAWCVSVNLLKVSGQTLKLYKRDVLLRRIYALFAHKFVVCHTYSSVSKLVLNSRYQILKAKT